MKTTKAFRAVALISIILAAALALTACSYIIPKPDPVGPNYTAEPVTDGPETEAPATDAPATDEPVTEAPEPEYFCSEIVLNSPYVCDLDFDGLDDSVEIVVTDFVEAWYGGNVMMRFTLGSDPENVIEFDYGDSYSFNCVVTDCDPYDGRLDVLLCRGYDSEDYSTYSYRVSEDGSAIKEIEASGYLVRTDGEFVNEGRFTLGVRADILETTFVRGEYTLKDGEFVLISDSFMYKDSRGVKVIVDLPVTLLEENGERGAETLIPVGAEVTPIETDMKTFVRVALSTGGEAVIDINFPDDSWIPYIGDEPQHYYLEVLYAD